MEDNNNTHLEYSNWLNSLAAATFVINKQGKVIYWNHACEILTAVKSQDVIKTNKHWMGFYGSERPCLADMVMDDDWERNTHLYFNIQKASNTPRGLLASNWCQTPAGNKFLIFEANALFDNEGKINGAIETLRDATDLKKMEEQLQKLSRAVESSPSVVFITNLDGHIEYVNPKFSEVTGYSSEEAIGQHPNILKSEKTPEKTYSDLWKTIVSGKEWKGELHSKKKNGKFYWSRNSVSGIKNNGKITHFVIIHEDITHEYELSEQILFQASHDELTGLYNRREFERRAELLFFSSQKKKEEHALCFMDLDQFKIVNDTCGHQAGDELLRQISTLLQQKVRKRDTLARLGGDEFAVLMEQCSLGDAYQVATTLLKIIQDYQFFWEGQSFRIGASIGLASITENTPDLTELLKRTDVACYTAKDLGRNRIHVYHDGDEEMSQRHGEMQWIVQLNKAIQEDRFCFYAQPIMALDKNENKHYELLLRMIDEQGEIIPPGAFLPAAERYNLIVTLDTWVINNAFELPSKYPKFMDQAKSISINVSGPSLTSPTSLDFIVEKLNSSEIDASKICFEITETAAISNLSAAIKFISTLKGLGCKFALDDFGSGLSSFAYLKNLPVDYLKIDGMFVKDIIDDPIDHAMVKSINEIGQVMGMQTIAEFVENEHIKDSLKKIGVNYVQGYGIGKPKPLDELFSLTN